MQRIDQKLFFFTSCLGLSLVALGLSGCGGGDEKPAEQTTAPATPTQQPAVAATQTTQVTGSPTTASMTVDPDRKETKWIGKIPYDVFYDQPLTIAADATVIGGGPAPNAGTSENTTAAMTPTASSHSPATDTASSSSSKAVDWKVIIPMNMLQDEVKAIRTRLNVNLQSVGNYNRSTEAIALDGAIVAGLGAIATVHPDADTWKDRSKFIRDLGYEIYSTSGGSGRAAYKATEDPFLKLQTALDGGTVDGLDSEDVVPFGDVIYVSDMMLRTEEIFGNLKANINTEARMKEDPEGVMRNLHMLAAFGSLMGTESYDNVEVEKYQELVAAFVGGAMKGIDAVKTENYEGFRDGLNEIQTTCSECHQQYRGADSGF